MVLDVIGAAILIAFGVFIIFFSVDSDASDAKLLLILFIGIVSIFAGGWLILSKISFGLILRKLAGLVLGFIGAFLLIGFPDIQDYQRRGFGITGIFIGLILAIVGFYLLLF